MKFLVSLALAIFFLCIGLGSNFTTHAQIEFPEEETNSIQETVLEAEIVGIIEESQTVYGPGQENLYQKIEVTFLEGENQGETREVEVNQLLSSGEAKYGLGDKVMVSQTSDSQGTTVYYIIDYVRRDSLIWLFLIFAVLVIAVGRWRGVSSLLGLGVSFLVIFYVILPNLLKGYNPIVVALLGGALIMIATFYLSHGVNTKTTLAILGTLVSLAVTGVLAQLFVTATRLTGFASEEAIFLQSIGQGELNIRGLLLAGIIIGALGVLDDITVSQAAIVKELKEANPKMKPRELFVRAMNIGRDHIASLVNTLVLVYAGSALPLLMLFVIDTSRSYSDIINYQIIAEEIVRTLVGSIGLVIAVPITTFLAAEYAGFDQKSKTSVKA